MAILAQELRIGNWVHHNTEWNYKIGSNNTTATTFHEFDFQWDETDWYALGECTMFLKNINPILLTKEWLLKFGFKYNGMNWVKDKLPMTDFRYNVSFTYFYKGKLKCNNISNPIKSIEIEYVHQFQNLYFALTGEELTVT